MTQPVFGMQFNIVDDSPLTPVFGDFSVVGLVLPSDDANATVFPLDTPVDINSSDPAMLTAAGTGPLKTALDRINAQLVDLQRSARVVVVRVATGVSDDATIANIVGSPDSKSGMYALLTAPSLLGVTPRIIGAPGFTGINRFGVGSPVVTAQGAGYTAATLAFNPNTGGAAGTVQVAGGKVTGITITNPGKFPSGTNVTVTINGDGSGATGTVALQRLNNPICAALPAVLEALMAVAPVGGPGTTKSDAIAWEGLLNSKRLIPVDNWEILDGGAEDNFYFDGAATAIGIAVRVDFQHNGFPFWSWANQPVQGLLGLKRIDTFSLIDGATDAQELLAAGIGVTVRGDSSDTSLTDSGFQFICYGTASTDANWELLNKVRGRDFMHLALLKSIRQRLGVDNVTVHSVQAVLNDMAAINSALKAQSCIIGWSCGFRSSDNTTAGLRAGSFTVYENAEQPAPILLVTVQSGTEERALTSELAVLDSELSDLVADV